jgi:exodeoxyribonuclease VII small subunit
MQFEENMNKDLTFEKALNELEEIVEKLEKNDLSLEEALSAFEHGISLSKSCIRCLNEVEKRIQKLSRDEKNKPILKIWEENNENF